MHSFILFSLLLDSIALLSFTVSRVCFCSYFLVTPGRSQIRHPTLADCGIADGVFVTLVLLQVAFSQRSLTRRPEAKQNKTHNLTLPLLPRNKPRVLADTITRIPWLFPTAVGFTARLLDLASVLSDCRHRIAGIARSLPNY